MRLFVAINLPADERARLYEGTRSLRHAGLPVRWTREDALHLTLKFLGSVEQDRVDAIRDAVCDIGARHRPFQLRIGGAGAYPSPARPRVWWIGIENTEPLRAVHDAVHGALLGLGFEPEKRAFSPHITIGRTRGGPGKLPEAWSLLEQIDCAGAFQVESVDVMESHLSPSGARYEVAARAPLASAEVT